VTAVSQSAQAAAIIALVSSTSVNKIMESLNRDLNAAIDIRRCAMLMPRLADLMRSSLFDQLLRLKLYKKELKRQQLACQKRLGGVCVRVNKYLTCSRIFLRSTVMHMLFMK